jgi:Tfp pilus assembly protein PilF
MRGMQNYASLTRWLDDHNNLSGLRIVEREGLAEDADDSPESFLKLGIVLHEEGNLPVAERAFRMAIQGRPTDPAPYLYFGKMLEESGHALAAEMQYRKANKATPDFAEAFKNFSGAQLYARHPSLRHNPEHPSRSGGGAPHRPR